MVSLIDLFFEIKERLFLTLLSLVFVSKLIDETVLSVIQLKLYKEE